MKQDTLQLDGCDYVCTALTARVGVRVAARLANAIAPAVKALPEDGLNLSPSSVAAMLEPIFTDPNLGDTLDFLINTFSERTVVRSASGEQPLSRVFDVQFSDAYDSMVTWLVFSIKLSLSSFFRGAPSLGALLARAGASASKSPSSAEPTGQSGE